MVDESPATSPRARARAVSIRDVAALAGVSVTTVSNVLNSTNRISDATRERVQRAIRELGYVRNAAAHQLRAGSSATIGLIVPDGSNPFYAQIARGAEDAAWKSGGTVLLGNSNFDPERESRYIDLFEQQRVLGVLIAPVADTTSRIEQLTQRGLTTVVVGRVAHPDRCSSVSVDNVAGGILAVRHLLDQGRRRIAFIGPTGWPGAIDRLAGARVAVEDAADASLEPIDSGGSSVADGHRIAEELAARAPEARPDAIFCANDLLATGVLHAFVDRGIRVPADVALIGYDDIASAASAIVPLSSIRQSGELIGRTAVELLQQEVADRSHQPRHVLFPPELVERRSTKG